MVWFYFQAAQHIKTVWSPLLDPLQVTVYLKLMLPFSLVIHCIVSVKHNELSTISYV